jgi:hypothetical protein
LNQPLLVVLQTAAFLVVGTSTLRICRGRGAHVSRAILAGGLAAGATMHVVGLVEDGFLAFPALPLSFNLFWASLAVVDPLAALLLSLRPRVGIALTLAIMLADVWINSVALGHVGFFAAGNWRLWSQVAFGVFAVAAAHRVWAARPSGPRRAP